MDIYSFAQCAPTLAGMCSESVAQMFRSSYPILGAITTIACVYVVSTSPPLHAEIYSTVVHPVNGTLQIMQCNTVPVPHCERVVDQPARLHVDIYHMSMGIPFVIVCGVGAVFCILTRKEVGDSPTAPAP